jgi:hypothetical protein
MNEIERHRLYQIADKLRDHLHGPALSTPNAEAVTALLAAMRRAADEIDYVVGESIARQIAELRSQGI